MKASVRTTLLSTAIILSVAQFSSPSSATPQAIGSHGVSSITNANSTTTVKQTASQATIDWKTIDTNSSETLKFIQPNSNSIALNYIKGGSPTTFAGKLDANGKVAIINPYGITFAAGSQVNVSALFATTASTFKQFGTGSGPSGLYNDIYVPVAKDYFLVQGFSDASIKFNGTVNAPNYIMAFARHIDVSKDATLTSEAGKIFLSAGAQRYGVNLHGKGVVYGSYSAFKTADVNVEGNLIAHAGAISVGSKTSDLVSAVVNLSGVVDTSNVAGNAGKVFLASTGDVNITGTANSTALNDSASKVNVGTIAVTSLHRDVNISGNLSTQTNAAAGKNAITLKAARDVNVTGGTIISAGNTASTTAVTATRNINLGGGVQAGDGKVALTSGGTTTVNGYIDAQGKQTGSLPSTTSVNGGTISIVSKGDVIANNYIDAGAPQGNAGNVTITSQTGNVTTNTKVAGNVVAITAKKDITLNNAHPSAKTDYITAYNGGYPTGPGTGGTIKLTSGGDTNINTYISSGNTNSGGSVTATAGKNVNVNAQIVTLSAKGKGGDVILKGQTVNNLTNAAYSLDGPTGKGSVIANGKDITSTVVQK